MAEAPRRVRLWLVAVALFGAGLGGRVVLHATTDPALSYPTAVGLQAVFYGAGLVVVFVSLGAVEDRVRGLLGCFGLIVLALVCGLMLVSSVPK